MDLTPHIELGARAKATYLRTVAKECKPLVLRKPRCRTLKSKHILLLSELKSGCLVFAIEVYVYLLFRKDQVERQIFVSKADTTGLSECRISIAGVVKEYIQHLVSIPVASYLEGAKWRPDEADASEENPEDKPEDTTLSEYDIVNTLHDLSERLKDPAFYKSSLFYQKQHSDSLQQNSATPIEVADNVITKVSLFTRSADSYIFPYSQKNKGKHIGDGNALFRWWLSVLAKSLDESWNCKADIPGSDARAVGRFLPNMTNWSIGNVYVDEGPNEKAIYSIPLFPDDPKGRFLEHLIVEGRYKTATTKQFWDELGFRQEFRLGNVVGIISCSQKASHRLLDGKGINPCISLKHYKKLMEVIKGEDFSKKDDINVLTNSTIPELFDQIGFNASVLEFTGSKPLKPVESGGNGTSTVNNLIGVVKRAKNEPKRAAVNNLTGLVKRKKN